MALINIQIRLTHFKSCLQQTAHTLSGADSFCAREAAVEWGYTFCHIQDSDVPLEGLFESLTVERNWLFSL